MVQLELGPRFIQPERFFEIESARNQILRVGVYSRWGTRFKEVSFDFALSTLFKRACTYFRENLFTQGCDVDLLASKVLKQALPFLEGEEGHFNSLGHFRNSLFRTILKHTALDKHRRALSSPRKHEETDDFSYKEVKRVNREGFQPTLFRLSEEQTKEEQVMELLLEDLKNPDGVLRPDYFRNSLPHRQRALELQLQYPHFTSGDIVKILTLEGYGEFDQSSVRVWKLRAKRAQRQKHLNPVLLNYGV